LALIRSFFDRFRVLPTLKTALCAKNFRPVRKSICDFKRTKIFARARAFGAQTERTRDYRAFKKPLYYRINCNVVGARVFHCRHCIMRIVIACHRAAAASSSEASASRVHTSLSGVAVFFVVL